jgi:DNA-binding response OmpR family regulator
MPPATISHDLVTRRILIVEDEPLLAMTLEEVLLDDGFVIAGIAGRLQEALDMIDRQLCDAAILDASLAGVSSEPVAIALRALGVPFVILSGNSPHSTQHAFGGALYLQKPCRPDRLLQALRSLLPEQST